MEGQTNCVLCEYKSKNLGSLKQHMESKHNVVTNMTVVQVLTQQVERVNNLEKELKAKEDLLSQAKQDLNSTNDALIKEKFNLEENKKALDSVIESQKQKAKEESNMIKELLSNKEILAKAQQDLENKQNALEAEMKANKAVKERKEVATQTIKNEATTLTMESSETVESSKQTDENKEQVKETSSNGKDLDTITCKYFTTKKGCRRGKSCWYVHENEENESKKGYKVNESPKKKIKVETNTKLKASMESSQEENYNMQQLIIELFKLCMSGKVNM